MNCEITKCGDPLYTKFYIALTYNYSHYTIFTMVLREQYTNFMCDLNQVYKSNLCFDPKEILKIDEIE